AGLPAATRRDLRAQYAGRQREHMGRPVHQPHVPDGDHILCARHCGRPRMSPAEDPALVTAEPPEPLRQVEQPLWTVVHVLLRCRVMVLAATALGTFLGVACGLMRPNSYTSTGTLLLRTGARETESAEAAVGGRDPRD